ncbi:CLUMA_CG006859, isoform A [Clunio marinus]|uniref:CLUMA_CG006859, isoform A n=1 Tax=Clunio marinus TaxID=568069 RepID=A0A1J1I385_9DIPT|nr:CLUMA_CG006859, isoform A [Clunio marinus]
MRVEAEESFNALFLNNIADTNEPTSVAVKLHRALFDDSDTNKIKLSSVGEPFSITGNLIQRKLDSTVDDKLLDAKTKSNKDSVNSISLATANVASNQEKLKHSKATTNKVALARNEREKLNIHVDHNNAQSFSDFFKSIFRCNATRTSNKKINEQIQLDYPLNLHFRMNEIFSMHDKLSDIAENFNDLYSAGCFSWDELSDCSVTVRYEFGFSKKFVAVELNT